MLTQQQQDIEANMAERASAAMHRHISSKAMQRLRTAQSPTGCTRPDSLIGLWAVEPVRFNELVTIAKSVDLVELAKSRQSELRAKFRADGAPSGPVPTLSPSKPKSEDGDDGEGMEVEDDGPEDPLYDVVNGIAVFTINGPMTKYQTSFQDILGGTATIPLRRALRQAASDPDVNCAVLCIDSPGGTAAGMTDLASDIRTLNAEKPCYAYIQDLGASGAYWAASQCSKIYGNASALVGCIGTMAILRDTSKAFEQQGVKVIVVTSDVPGGDTMKGAGADGTPITPDQLTDFKRQINEQNDLFVADVAAGRKMTPANVRALADGRIHVGEKARALGLVDEIASFDAAMQAIYQENYSMTADQFRAFASANPEDATVKSLLAQGHKAGKAEGLASARSDLGTMLTAFPGREKFAAEQFVKGHDAISAKADLADVQADEIKQLRAQLADKSAQAALHADDNPSLRLPADGTATHRTPTQVAAAAGAGTGSPTVAIAAFEAAWKVHATAGMPQAQAIARVVKEQPQIYESYRAALAVTQPARRRD